MTIKYLTISEAQKKYELNISKFTFAIRNANLNGLYKAVFRKRTRIYLHQEFLEKWLETNDVKSPCKPSSGGRPRNNKETLTFFNKRTSKDKGKW